MAAFNDFPNIDLHGGVDQLKLVNQCDIDIAKDIFQQLVASATRQEETGTSSRSPYHKAPWRDQGKLQVYPPTTFGIDFMLLSRFAGSSRSGGIPQSFCDDLSAEGITSSAVV